MIVPGSTNPLLMRSAAPAAYQISRSLRFNSADSAQLSKTFSSAGNRKTWTWSGWIKRGLLGYNTLFTGYTDSGNNGHIYFYLDQIGVQWEINSVVRRPVTAAVFRDTSAWMHIVIVADTTQATSTDRIKIYINNVQQTLTGTYPNQDSEGFINNAVEHRIGSTPELSAADFDGYMADIWFVGGSALTPSDFAETNATTGQWVPKAYTGSTSGTNTFHLDFADNSGTTSTTLGKDTSGNSNNFTPSGFSVTAGSGNDSLTDTPTSYGTDTGTGGEVRGNYASWSPLYGATPTLSNGNLEASVNATTAYSSISVTSGKWYWEITPTGTVSTTTYIGIIDSTYIKTDASWSSQARCYVSNANKYDGSTTSYGASYAANDVIGVALDLDAGTLVFYKNGSSQGTAFSTGLTGKEWKALAYSGSSATHIANFGQRAFAYTAPSGFKALVDTNLTAPTIAKPSTAFDVVTYTGTGSALTPTSSLGFSPDLIWIKSRSAATDHTLYDTVRGAEKRLESNNTDAEVTSDGGVTAFNSNGFTLGTLAQVNTNAATYVGWCWDGGTSTVTNTNGTITSSVRANASAGISIIDFSATNGTVGHGLGVAPDFFVYKARTSTSNWSVYHKSLGNTKRLLLNLTDAETASSTYWNNTSPTSTVITLGSNFTGAGSSVIYAFASVSGFSSFGSYTGNGSADGPFVYTGHRSRWVMIKRTDVAGDWIIWDALRPGYNASQLNLYPNLPNVENAAGYNIDIVSNGFKLRDAGGTSFNTSGGTYVYAAWASAPFPYARAR